MRARTETSEKGLIAWFASNHVAANLLMCLIIVAGIIWFVRKSDGDHGPGQSGARAELDMRFARGEIDAEDYAARKKLLTE